MSLVQWRQERAAEQVRSNPACWSGRPPASALAARRLVYHPPRGQAALPASALSSNVRLTGNFAVICGAALNAEATVDPKSAPIPTSPVSCRRARSATQFAASCGLSCSGVNAREPAHVLVPLGLRTCCRHRDLGAHQALQGVQLPDGERYRRMNVQGPFVPLSAEEIEADRKRIESRSAAA